MFTILLVEDDEIIGQAAQRWLNKDNHVHWARTRNEAVVVLDSIIANIVILDLELPNGSGLDVLAAIKHRKLKCTVLTMTSCGDIDHSPPGLDLAANDHLVKPIDFKELDARIAALKRRSDELNSRMIEVGGVQLDIVGKRATKNGAAVHLSNKEFSILSILMQGANRYYTKAMLDEQVQGRSAGSEGNAIEVHISSIRKKLGKTVIKTSRGLGYIVESSIRTTTV